MGGTSYSAKEYSDRASMRAASPDKPVFAHHAAVKKGTATSTIHPTLSPVGLKVRESRDTAAHPTSRAIAVFLDVTGSMRNVPKMIQKKLPLLMGTLIRKSFIEHPHILIGAVGDAYSDKAPLQIGQFEAGIEVDDNITNLYMEGGGGGSNHESYELALWAMAHKTAMDCYEKRGEKGYLFLIGDEKFYTELSSRVLEAVFGTTALSEQEDKGIIKTADIWAELLKKFEVFFINPNMTAGYGDEDVLGQWREKIGQNVLKLEDPNGICELIASAIGVVEGHSIDTVTDALTEEGTSAGTIAAVTTALRDIKPADKAAMAVSAGSSGHPSGLTTV